VGIERYSGISPRVGRIRVRAGGRGPPSLKTSTEFRTPNDAGGSAVGVAVRSFEIGRRPGSWIWVSPAVLDSGIARGFGPIQKTITAWYRWARPKLAKPA
jgi:hypothetical protein